MKPRHRGFLSKYNVSLKGRTRMTTEAEVVTLQHSQIFSSLQTYMHMLLLDSAFKTTKALEQKFLKSKLFINDGERCYTSMEHVFIGMKFTALVDQSIDEQYHLTRYIIGHEVGHMRLTSKRDWDSSVIRYNRDLGRFGHFARDLLNILEDRRMEYGMGMISPYLQRGFFVLGYRIVKNFPKEMQKTLDEALALGTVSAKTMLNVVRQAILYMSFTRMIPPIKNKEAVRWMKQIYPYIVYARKTKHTKFAVKATDQILSILQPLMDAYEEEDDSTEKIPSIFYVKDMGSYEPSDTSGIGEEGAKEGFAHSEETEKMMDKLIEEVKEELEEEAEEEGTLEVFKTTEIKRESTPRTGKATAEESGLRENVLRDYVDDITGNLESEFSGGEITPGHVKLLEADINEPVTKLILHKLLHSTKIKQKQNVKTQREETRIKELEAKVSSSAMHKHCKAVFKPREIMESFTQLEYSQLLEPLAPIIRKSVDEIKTISQKSMENILRGQRTGRLDRRAITNYAAFNDPKIFRTKEIDIEQMKMDVMLLIDVSGSNGAQMLNKKNDERVPRYVMNQIIGILLHETLKNLKFDHSIWTFDEAAVSHQRFSAIIDHSNCFDPHAGLCLKEVGAFAGNRDGYAIRYAGEYLNRWSTNDKRLLIVLSDGQPAASGYGGKSAMEDVKQAVTEVENGGSKVVGIFTGSEEENKYFNMMYDKPIFANNENIFELPKVLRQMLIKEFQEYMEKIV
jgi:hypothetical protein